MLHKNSARVVSRSHTVDSWRTQISAIQQKTRIACMSSSKIRENWVHFSTWLIAPFITVVFLRGHAGTGQLVCRKIVAMALPTMLAILTIVMTSAILINPTALCTFRIKKEKTPMFTYVVIQHTTAQPLIKLAGVSIVILTLWLSNVKTKYVPQVFRQVTVSSKNVPISVIKKIRVLVHFIWTQKILKSNLIAQSF